MSQDSDANLRALYEQVCKQYDAIANFRAKLLGFLPFASGIGVFVLFQKDIYLNGEISDHISILLTAAGWFGFVVTIGLFIYELHGIHKCNALVRAGISLEKSLAPIPKGAFQ